MRKTLIIATTLLIALTLQTTPTHAENPCDKAVIAYRIPAEDPDTDECIAFITVGYAHGIETGQTGELHLKLRGGLRPKKKVLFEVIDTDAYLSACRLEGVTADEEIKVAALLLDCQEWSMAKSLDKAAVAFELGDWDLSHHLYSRWRDSLPLGQTELVSDRIDLCDRHMLDERNRTLSRDGTEEEINKIPLNWNLAIHYMLRCEYAAAEEYCARILRVADDHKPAREMCDLIDTTAKRLLRSDEQSEHAVNDSNTTRPTAPKTVFPVMIHETRAELPPTAEQEDFGGSVLVKLMVSTEGIPVISEIYESSGREDIDYAAVKASYDYRFEPGQQNGKPVRVWVAFRVPFAPAYEMTPPKPEEACDKDIAVYRLSSDDKDANECIAFVTVGYVNGIDDGFTGELSFKTSRGDVKKATLEILDTDAYLSACRLIGVGGDETIVDDTVLLKCRQWSLAQNLEIADKAYKAADWAKAQHFYAQCRDSIPSDQSDLICDRLDLCARHLLDKRNRKLSSEEIRKEKDRIPLYQDLTVQYLLRCDYAAAREYNKRILRVDKRNGPAEEARAMIDMVAGVNLAQEEADKHAVCNIDDILGVNRERSTNMIFPRLIHEGMIVYPEKAARNGIEGAVVVKSLISAEGEPLSSTIARTSGSADLDYAAVKASYTNKYKPAQQDGEPVAVWVTYKVEFMLPPRY